MQHILMLPCSLCECIAACLFGREELVDVVSMVEVFTIQWIGAGADLRVIRGVSQVSMSRVTSSVLPVPLRTSLIASSTSRS